MSLKTIIIEAGERYADKTTDELSKEAYIYGKMYEACYFAAGKDLIKAAKYLKADDAPLIKIAKAAYAMVFPFSATVVENGEELREEFAAEYDSRSLVKDLFKTVEDDPEDVVENEKESATEITPTEAVTLADIASGTVQRGQAHLKPLPHKEFRRSYMK